uniref:Putative secreted peptide n=1 Tax=Anopheles braziliensis TaxID=58242 RepID=A0A2M3ZN64_9DIPT
MVAAVAEVVAAVVMVVVDSLEAINCSLTPRPDRRPTRTDRKQRSVSHGRFSSEVCHQTLMKRKSLRPSTRLATLSSIGHTKLNRNHTSLPRDTRFFYSRRNAVSRS